MNGAHEFQMEAMPCHFALSATNTGIKTHQSRNALTAFNFVCSARYV